jgi:chitinase
MTRPPRPAALVAALGLAAALLGPAAAPAPAADEVAEPTQDALRAVKVLGYVETSADGTAPEALDLAACTHVIDAFLLPAPTGAIEAANGIPRRDLVRAAHARGVKALVAVGGATVPGATFAAIARGAGARARFLDELARLVVAGSYDGVDLDWEFPAADEGALHVALAHAIRARLEADFARAGRGQPLLTVGISPGSRLLAYDFPGLAREADYVIHMGYDFRNPALGPWASDAQFWPDGAARPIEGSVRGVASEVVRRGLPREKLVVGLPLYASDGRPWAAVRARALVSAAPLHPLYLERAIDGAWVTDAAALAAKARAITAGAEIAGGAAAGVALWQLGHEGRYRDLTDALRRALPPGAPCRPRPVDGAEIGAAAGLAWDASFGDVEGFEVYLGRSEAAVAAATTATAAYAGRVREPLFQAPRGLEAGAYAWRVDAVGPGGAARGPVWRFRVQGEAGR